MKNITRSLAMLVALVSLAGCGLKGPLYFPPADKSAPVPTQPAENNAQPSMPNSNDRGDTGGPTQVNY